MNKTQKGAWFNVAGVLLFLPFVFYLIIQIGIRHRLPERFWLYILGPALVLLIVIGMVLFRRKQSPAEPESDERDNQIKQRAVLAAFVSVLLLFLGASVVPQFIVGLDGSIPVWLLPIVNVLLFYIVLFVYSVAILFQSGRG